MHVFPLLLPPLLLFVNTPSISSSCYTFPRCSRSVSYATPAYLADRLATRGALLLGTDAMDDSVSVASGQTEQTALQLLAQARGRVAQIHRTQAARLFFMSVFVSLPLL